jgi:transposase
VWAVEGCNGIGRHIAQRLLADGETVMDVPAKRSARARVFATGQGRKTDPPVDAHSVAVAALRANGLRQVAVDDETVVLRLLVDRRDGLGRARTDLTNRIHKLLLELLPGGAKTIRAAGTRSRAAQGLVDGAVVASEIAAYLPPAVPVGGVERVCLFVLVGGGEQDVDQSVGLGRVLRASDLVLPWLGVVIKLLAQRVDGVLLAQTATYVRVVAGA